jgi:hypothetical protein
MQLSLFKKALAAVPAVALVFSGATAWSRTMDNPNPAPAPPSLPAPPAPPAMPAPPAPPGPGH